MSRILIYFILSVTSVNSFAGDSADSDDNHYCFQVAKAKDDLGEWIKLALQDNPTIGCPSISSGSPLSRLEIVSQQNGKCSKEASSILLAFYSIFAHQPNYNMCGLVQKEDVLISRISVHEKICATEVVDKIEDCFLRVNKIISDLKIRGELNTAFELAKKTANSNDVTGLSQMILGVMYGFGEGMNKDLTLAIKWLKVALEKCNDRETKINILMVLGVFYEQLGDYTNAKYYIQQCAIMGNTYCKKGLANLNQ